MAKTIKFALAALTVIICYCGHGGAIDCFMGKQPDPRDPKLGLRWVLPYTKDALCTCTKILFGGMNPAPLPGSDKFFYTDDPLTLVNNDNVAELREKLQCSSADSKDAVVSSTRQTITKSKSSTQEQLTTEDAVESTTRQIITNSGSTSADSATDQLTTEGNTTICQGQIDSMELNATQWVSIKLDFDMFLT
ncbi:uncharacterized protein [Amphiura filiformis]|uniref:uncharacterized protein n=1 Tax=Amphiura filiformis TaxID=82378 RepID=UPI003B2206EA